ncbi:GNAT family N-acetyltransferase [Facklamia miroungae]|uniref:Diamine N-acetyltransferase n=1 Tax=Facklamia miroungae TaxID=120956 RepID=A0A1G7UCG4_9LACT|nr:GNAT family N-acetyltransferase [Facklamia miroungae]NKZ30027.1 GNAT family N-acetyltransferase [Facklamia miroungae]SDG44440.1 diamine N-acetyltransferase [Facklamia miroungae]
MNKNIIFKKSKIIKISLDKNQNKQISSHEKICKGCSLDNVVAYDIFYENNVIGFAMLRKYDSTKWFLWNYAIDKNFQGRGLGEESLQALILLMKREYDATEISTTYLFGNDAAKKLYTKVGFYETEVIEETDCHEVNMLMKL